MRTLIPAVSFLLLTACVQDVGKGKVKAEVEDVPTETTKEAPAAPAGETTTLNVDVSQSSLKALGAKVTATHPIIFHQFSGTVDLAGETVSGVSFTAQVDSLEADHPKLTAHLKDADFLHVAQFPTATFQSVSVTEGSQAEGDWTHTVKGDMTIRGKTKRVTFPANITVAADAVKASTEFVLDRQDFEVTYPGRPDDLVQDNVRMTIAFVAPRA